MNAIDDKTELMRGKTCLVTGGSSGIGKATALGLARLGARVGIVCHNVAHGEAARREIGAAAGENGVDLFLADLTSGAAIRELAAAVHDRYSQLQVLVNNAGGLFTQRIVTVDGLEQTFALNHLAYFHLTNLLLDLLKAGAPARIVSVSSDAQASGSINFADLQGARAFSPMYAYSQSKLANVLFTYELARRLAGTGVTANCLHPGAVRTGFGHNATGIWRLLLLLYRPFMISPQDGAATSIYLASSPKVEGMSGRYFVKQQPVRSSPASYNTTVARQLWDVSAALAELHPTG